MAAKTPANLEAGYTSTIDRGPYMLASPPLKNTVSK